MPQASLVADARRAWSEGERVFDANSLDSPHHDTARLLVFELRQLYAELT